MGWIEGMPIIKGLASTDGQATIAARARILSVSFFIGIPVERIAYFIDLIMMKLMDMS